MWCVWGISNTKIFCYNESTLFGAFFMKLLILTQKVSKDDPELGFFHAWLVAFSNLFEKVIVICLEKGEYDLPNNVEVYSLGKEKGVSKLTYIVRFYKYVFKFRDEYDRVFVHMNPEYIVMGGLLWRLWKKKILLWYTHRSVTRVLKIAYALTNTVATAAKESFNIKGNKVNVLGHGIDTSVFTKRPKTPETNKIRLLHIGRITPIKHLEVLIDALGRLDSNYELTLVGEPVKEEDHAYKEKLLSLIKKKELLERVHFVGPATPSGVVDYLVRSHGTVNLAPTGGIDKSVLEALACGVPTFVSNKAFKDIYGTLWEDFSFSEGDSINLAKRILVFFELSEQSRGVAIDALSLKVRNGYSVEAITKKLAILISEMGGKA